MRAYGSQRFMEEILSPARRASPSSLLYTRFHLRVRGVDGLYSTGERTCHRLRRSGRDIVAAHSPPPLSRMLERFQRWELPSSPSSGACCGCYLEGNARAPLVPSGRRVLCWDDFFVNRATGGWKDGVVPEGGLAADTCSVGMGGRRRLDGGCCGIARPSLYSCSVAFYL